MMETVRALDGGDRRDGVLAGLPLVGKRVLDLHAQRGENLRRAIRAGARYAEGIEASPQSVNAGRLINAALGFDAATLRCADLEAPGCLATDFDVGLCLADSEMTQTALARIVPRIQDLMLMRISFAEDEWYGRRLRPLATLLPYWSLLPFHEPEPEPGRRSSTGAHGLLAAGRDRSTVALAMAGRLAATGNHHPSIRCLEVQRSSRAHTLMGSSPDGRALILDLRRRLTLLAAPDPREVVAVIQPSLPALSRACRELPPREVDFGTDRYWLRFLQGLVQWIESGVLTLENPYVRFIRGAAMHGACDPGMRHHLEDGARALRRLEPRLQGFLAALLDRTNREPLVLYNPISVAWMAAHGYRPGPGNLDHHVTFANGREYRIQCSDGNHRLAALWLCGASQAWVLPVWTNLYGEDPEMAQLAGPDIAAGPGIAADAVLQQSLTRAVRELTGGAPAFARAPDGAAQRLPGTSPMV